MVNLRQETIDTYNKRAKELSEFFKGIGPREKYIDIAFQAAGNPKDARVIEIGCGDGRDAEVIVKRSGYYHGFDISTELIRLAKNHLPHATFTVDDAVNFSFPDNLDIVFAFASILHFDKKELQDVLQKVHDALRLGGVFYISSKYRSEYSHELKEDEFGKRLFYFYNAEVVAELAGSGYEVATAFLEVIGHTDWFEMALRKKS